MAASICMSLSAMACHVIGAEDACHLVQGIVAVQAGAGSVLNAPDGTGMVPAQLAREKGHRFLAHYLEEYASRHVNKSRCVDALQRKTLPVLWHCCARAQSSA